MTAPLERRASSKKRKGQYYYEMVAANRTMYESMIQSGAMPNEFPDQFGKPPYWWLRPSDPAPWGNRLVAYPNLPINPYVESTNYETNNDNVPPYSYLIHIPPDYTDAAGTQYYADVDPRSEDEYITLYYLIRIATSHSMGTNTTLTLPIPNPTILTDPRRKMNIPVSVVAGAARGVGHRATGSIVVKFHFYAEEHVQ